MLSHVGYEFSLIGKDQSPGDPNRLRPALEEGATVIAAHACSSGLMIYEKFFPTLLEFVKRYPNFYADVSALTLPEVVSGIWTGCSATIDDQRRVMDYESNPQESPCQF